MKENAFTLSKSDFTNFGYSSNFAFGFLERSSSLQQVCILLTVYPRYLPLLTILFGMVSFSLTIYTLQRFFRKYLTPFEFQFGRSCGPLAFFLEPSSFSTSSITHNMEETTQTKTVILSSNAS